MRLIPFIFGPRLGSVWFDLRGLVPPSVPHAGFPFGFRLGLGGEYYGLQTFYKKT